MDFYLTSHKEASKTTPQAKACYKLTLKIRDQTKPTNIITNKEEQSKSEQQPKRRGIIREKNQIKPNRHREEPH
jgi:hypothetical protein